jgi:hypothetical protein
MNHAAIAFQSTVKQNQISQQADVQSQANDTGQRGGPHDRVITTEESVHRGGEQPLLHHDQDENDA